MMRHKTGQEVVMRMNRQAVRQGKAIHNFLTLRRFNTTACGVEDVTKTDPRPLDPEVAAPHHTSCQY